MSESDRVQRWREKKRQDGLKACTIWLTEEEELRLKDLAVQEHCSQSKIVQQALAQFSVSPLRSSNVTDKELIRELIRAELAAMPAPLGSITDNVTVTVTDTQATDTTPEPGIEDVSDANSDVTDTEVHEQTTEAPAAAPTRSAAKRPAPPVLASAQNGTAAQPPGKRKGGRTSTLRQPIVNLLRAHPEGLTAVQMKVHIGTDRNMGDVLQGMVRNRVLEKQGTGAQVKYFAVGAPQTPPAAPLAFPVPSRRKRQPQPA